MPNWCDNTVEIYGDKKTIAKVVAFVGRPFTRSRGDGSSEYVENPVFSFQNIKPSTHDIDKSIALFPSGGPDDWYHNNINSWGTKWDVDNSDSLCSNIGETSATYSFSSAWSPPCPVIERLAEIFPEVSITHTFYEGGCDFWGIDKYESGEKVSEEGGELDHNAWITMGMKCWNCEQYEEDPEEYEEYLYSDCPPALEKAKATA